MPEALSAEIAAALERLAEGQDRLLQELQALRGDLQDGADQRLYKLLPAAFAVVGPETFTAWDLMESAASSLPYAGELGVAVLDVVGRGNPAGGVRRLGRYLTKNAGAVAADFRLVRLKRLARVGAVYRIEQVSRVFESPNFATPAGSV